MDGQKGASAEFVDGQTIGQLTGEFVDGQTIGQLTGEFVDGQTIVPKLAGRHAEEVKVKHGLSI